MKGAFGKLQQLVYDVPIVLSVPLPAQLTLGILQLAQNTILRRSACDLGPGEEAPATGQEPVDRDRAQPWANL